MRESIYLLTEKAPLNQNPAEDSVPQLRTLDDAWTRRDSHPGLAFQFAESPARLGDDADIAAQANVVKAFLLYRRNELHQALPVVLDAINQLLAAPLTPWSGRASNTAALVYSSLGLPELAIEYSLRGQQQSQSVGDDATTFACFHNMGVELGQIGDHDGSLRNFDRAEPFASASLSGQAYLALNRCDVHLDRGDVVAAVATVNQGKRHWQAPGHPARLYGLFVEARVALAASQLTLAGRALRSVRQEFDPVQAGAELPMLEAQHLLQRRDPDAAEAVLEAHGLGVQSTKVKDIHLAARLAQIHVEVAEFRGDLRGALAIERAARLNEKRHNRQTLSRATALITHENQRQLDQKCRELEVQNTVVADLRSRHDQVSELSLCDHLTGLYNRRYLSDHVDDLVQHHQRHVRNLSVLVFDIDNFKSINDTYLHATGDEVLKTIADLMRSQKRSSDVLCRVGGDEFVAFLPETDLHQAQKVAKRLISAVSSHDWSTLGHGLSVSVSVGATTAHAEDSLQDMLFAADRAMYKAKSAGKNQVRVSV